METIQRDTMNTKHTPGPWVVGNTKAGGTHQWLSVIGSDAQPVAHMCREVGDTTRKGGGVSGANARLIAAAPELLAALQALVGEADLGEMDMDSEDLEKIEAARAAIAKATGQA